MTTPKMEELRRNHTALLENLVKAFDANDGGQQSSIVAKLGDNEKEYATEAQLAVFGECKQAEDPMYEFLCRRTYDVLSHVIDKTDAGVPVNAHATTRSKDLDLQKFCKFMGMSLLWTYKVEKLNQLLCLDAAASLGYSKDDLKKLKLDYALSKEASDEKLPGVSNTQLCKTMQVIVDAIIFEDNGKGGNTYKVCSPDAAYLRKVYTRRAACGVVKVAKTAFVQRIICDVLHKLVIGGRYSVDGYKVVKEQPAEKPAKSDDAPIVADAPAAAPAAE